MTLQIDTLGPFDLRPGDLTRIDAGEAVELVRQLLVIEACRVGTPVTGVDVPSAIDVADGGIDAEVVGVAGTVLPAGLISEGLTRYQIKTGSFSASRPSEIKSLLAQPRFATGERQLTKDELHPCTSFHTESFQNFVVSAAQHGLSQSCSVQRRKKLLCRDFTHDALRPALFTIGTDEDHGGRPLHSPAAHQGFVRLIISGDIGPQYLHARQTLLHFMCSENPALVDLAADAPIRVEVDERPLTESAGPGDPCINILDGLGRSGVLSLCRLRRGAPGRKWRHN